MLRLLLSASLTFLIFMEAQACGFFILGDEYRVALFNPYLIGQEYELFFYSSEKFHPGTTAEAGRDRMRNVQEWARELGDGVTPKNALDLIYKTSLKDWRAAANGQANKTFKANPAWAAFAQRPGLVDYMLWAKEYEKPADLNHYWWLDEEEDTTQKQQDSALAQVAKREYEKAESGTFLQRRWAYQLLLLAYYEDDLPTADRLFSEHFESDNQSVLADWARFHLANFYQDPIRKTILLANAFRVVPEKAHAVWTRTPADFKVEDYLPQASSDFERSNLYALAAAKSPGRALELIKQAHAYDANNPVLDLLVTREINKLEDWLMTYRLTNMSPAVPAGYLDPVEDRSYEDIYLTNFMINPAYIQKNYQRDRAYLTEVRAFIRNFKSPRGLDALYRAHLALLDEDYPGALTELGKRNGGDEARALQADIIRFVAEMQRGDLKIAELKTLVVDRLPGIEESLAPAKGTEARKQWDENRWYYYGQNPERRNRAKALSRAASLRFEELRDTVAAYFLYNRSLPYTNGYSYSSDYYSKIDYLDRGLGYSIYDDIVHLLDGPGNDPFSQFIRRSARVEVNAVRDVAATVALRRNDLHRALGYLEPISRSWYDKTYLFTHELSVSPFDYAFEPPSDFPGKAAVVETLIELAEDAAGSDETAAQACFDLANAWYNMSYYGESWMMTSYGWSGYLEPGYEAWPFTKGHAALPHNFTDYGATQSGVYIDQYLDCAASLTDDPELAARVEYLKGLANWEIKLATKVGLNYWSEDYTQQSDSLYKASFQTLRDNYAGTRFYNTVMNQCGTFADL